MAPLARALIDANPERVLWGSDWPHPHAAAPGSERDALTPFYDIDDGLALNQLADWAPDAAMRRRSWSKIRRDYTTSEPMQPGRGETVSGAGMPRWGVRSVGCCWLLAACAREPPRPGGAGAIGRNG